MALWVCNRCTTRFAVGLPYCPQCTSTDHREDGEMPKNTVHGGASNATLPAEPAPSAPAPATDLNPADEAGQDSAPAPDSEDYSVRTIAELRQLLRDRNAERDEDSQLPLSGNKDELVARLQSDDQDQGE